MQILSGLNKETLLAMSRYILMAPICFCPPGPEDSTSRRTAASNVNDTQRNEKDCTFSPVTTTHTWRNKKLVKSLMIHHVYDLVEQNSNLLLHSNAGTLLTQASFKFDSMMTYMQKHDFLGWKFFVFGQFYFYFWACTTRKNTSLFHDTVLTLTFLQV